MLIHLAVGTKMWQFSIVFRKSESNGDYAHTFTLIMGATLCKWWCTRHEMNFSFSSPRSSLDCCTVWIFRYFFVIWYFLKTPFAPKIRSIVDIWSLEYFWKNVTNSRTKLYCLLLRKHKWVENLPKWQSTKNFTHHWRVTCGKFFCKRLSCWCLARL